MGLKSGECGALVADNTESLSPCTSRGFAPTANFGTKRPRKAGGISNPISPRRCVGRQLETLLSWSASFTSIIVLAHNQWEHTEKCLLEHCPPDAGAARGDFGGQRLDRQHLGSVARIGCGNPRLRVVINRDNRGFAAGNNQGLALARGGNMVLLNNDTVVRRRVG